MLYVIIYLIGVIICSYITSKWSLMDDLIILADAKKTIFICFSWLSLIIYYIIYFKNYLNVNKNK